MKLTLPGVLILLFMPQVWICGQIQSSPQASARKLAASSPANSQVWERNALDNDLILGAQAIRALKRLEDQVIVNSSLGEFEMQGRLARVSIDVFKHNLQEVTGEIQSILSLMRPSRLKREIANTLASYRDGEFWWRKIYQPRTLNISAMSLVNTSGAPPDTFLVSTIPYTVAIYWRQAANYLKRAEKLMKHVFTEPSIGDHAGGLNSLPTISRK